MGHGTAKTCEIIISGGESSYHTDIKEKNPTLRHLNRTHRVNVSWLCEVFRNLKEVELIYCKTDAMAADIFTKAFMNPIKWNAALDLIGITHA